MEKNNEADDNDSGDNFNCVAFDSSINRVMILRMGFSITIGSQHVDDPTIVLVTVLISSKCDVWCV